MENSYIKSCEKCGRKINVDDMRFNDCIERLCPQCFEDDDILDWAEMHGAYQDENGEWVV